MGDKDLQQSKIAGCAPRRAPECATPRISTESGVEIPPEITTETTTKPTPETTPDPRRVDDPELARLIDLWNELTPTVRECVLAMVEGSVRMEKIKRK